MFTYLHEKGSRNSCNYELLHLDFDRQYIMLCYPKALLAGNQIMTLGIHAVYRTYQVIRFRKSSIRLLFFQKKKKNQVYSDLQIIINITIILVHEFDLH